MKYRSPRLIPGYHQHQGFRNPKRTTAARWGYPLTLCRFLMEDAARRVAESKKQFPWKFYRGDCHSHTQHSDGIGTVAETAEMVKAAKLDFQFVTDHWGVTQAPECRKHGLWVGQEPLTQHHHMGILGLDHAFAPRMDFLADCAEAQRRGAVVFIPHPTGWWPVTQYSEKQKRVLEKLPSPFLMEICNGANNIVNAFDYTDASALDLWDHLLGLGRVVHALGNTDTHAPHGIGMVWNGVFAVRCSQRDILQSLSMGRSFVSSGPLVHLQLGGTQMGGKARGVDRKAGLRLAAVDSKGLERVRVVADGREVVSWNLKRTSRFAINWRIPSTIRRYVRMEARAGDDARAYSNPIYFAA